MILRSLDLGILRRAQSAFLFGPRGVGKTSLAREFLAAKGGALEIDLLEAEQFSRYLRQQGRLRLEVEAALERPGPLTVFIDEVQKLPGLLDEVHSLIERHKGRLQFLLSGSSARKLKRGGANLLAGRAWTLHLHPLTHREVKLDLSRALRFGTLPAVYLEGPAPERTLRAYVDTYLKEEIMQEALVRNVSGFARFLDVAGQMHGEPINFTAVARDSGVSVKTAQEFFSILVDTLVAFRIDGWSRSVRKQLRQSPKFYFFDCGVLNAIRGELQTELRERSSRYGRLFETFMLLEILRLNDYSEAGYRFAYWRTNTGLEVDVVLSKGAGRPPIAVEVKSKPSPGVEDFHALKSFLSENPGAALMCLCSTPRAYNAGPVQVLPWIEGLKKLFP